MKKLLTCLGLVMALAASGCTLYFGPEDDDVDCYCDGSGCYGSECGGNGGYGCLNEYGEPNDYACAAGCYCSADGECIETGFCSTDADCADGLVCDDRASCVPGSSDCWNTGCPTGEYCDWNTGACEPSETCTTDADCGTGWWCNQGTCNPLGCTDDNDCAAGCYCDLETGGCIETSYCTSDEDCTVPGETCDETRSTCIPGEDPPPACEDLTDETSCAARADCDVVYGGVNCTDPNGNSCTEPGAQCTCESYYFAACITTPST